MAIDLSDYNDVPSRIAEFREKHPDGTFQSEIVDAGIPGFVTVKGYAYRTPDDPRPGIGLAWEPVPGKTPYTKDSELQNAETSAWGRAIIAAGAADAKKGIATAEDVRNRQEVTAQAPSQSIGEYMATQVLALSKWSKEQQTEAYKAVMEELRLSSLESLDMAKAVFEGMHAAYMTEHPANPDEAPF